MRNPSIQLTPPAAEIRVQIIEQCGAALQTLCVRHPGGTQSVDQAGNAACLLTRELAVLQVDVVHDLADCGQRGIRQAASAAAAPRSVQRSPSWVNSASNMSKRSSPGARRVAFRRHELERRLRVDEAADQPGGCDPIHMHIAPRHPDMAGAGHVASSLLASLRRGFQSGLPARPRRASTSSRAVGAEEVDRGDARRLRASAAPPAPGAASFSDRADLLGERAVIGLARGC